MSNGKIATGIVCTAIGAAVPLILFGDIITDNKVSFKDVAEDIISEKSTTIENIEQLTESFDVYLGYKCQTKVWEENSQKAYEIVRLQKENKVFELDASVDAKKGFEIIGENKDTILFRDFEPETVAAALDALSAVPAPTMK